MMVRNVFIKTTIFVFSSILLIGATAVTGCTKPLPQPAPAPAPAPTTEEVPVTTKEPEPELFLEILSPKDESIVQTEEITVTGDTLPTAIVSVNGILTLVKEDGGFSSKITLEEGPNLIEVVASDVGGDEVGEILTIIYMPK